MEQEAVIAWHYEEKGERKGPVTDSAMKQLIEDGKLTYGNMVWKKGWPNWMRLEDSELKIHLNDNQPPPLMNTNQLSPISNKMKDPILAPINSELLNPTVVWILAFAPLLGFLLEYIVAGTMHDNNRAAMDAAIANHAYWYIAAVLNIGLAYFDEHRLRKAGFNTDKFRGMTWLVPVYLYQRSKALKQNKGYLIVWIVCLAYYLMPA